MASALRLPLTWLAVPGPAPTLSPPVPRTLDLEPPAALARWAATVREATEAVLLLDTEGRVVAVSLALCALLQLEKPVGVRLPDLVSVVDPSASALPQPEAAEQLPCLRVLRGQGPFARTLVRLRRGPGPDGLLTLDAVGVAVESGALGFFSEV